MGHSVTAPSGAGRISRRVETEDIYAWFNAYLLLLVESQEGLKHLRAGVGSWPPNPKRVESQEGLKHPMEALVRYIVATTCRISRRVETRVRRNCERLVECYVRRISRRVET